MPKNILVVEDQPDVRDLIRETLEMDGHGVREAGDGAGALGAMSNERFDCVLLDVRLPGALDGLAVCQRIKRQSATRRTKVVMLTSCDRPEDRDAGRAAGADAYLTKPFSPRELLEMLARTA